jgi:hypothetical protein
MTTLFASVTKNRRMPHGSIRQRVNDLKAKSDSLCMHRVNVIDLNGHVRLWLGGSGLLHERDPSRWIARRDERDNPIHGHSHVEAQETRVELPALMPVAFADLTKRDFARRLCLMSCAILTADGQK